MITLDSGLSLSFWSQGESDAPTVVFIPGPTDSWRSYQPVLDALPADLRVVAVSLRGHGDSSKPTSGYRIEDLSSDVVPFLDELDISRATLVGHSGSGFVVRRVALLTPDRVAGLVSEACPTSLRADAKLRAFVDSVVSELREPIDHDVARAFVADTSSAALPAALVETLVEDLMKVPVRAWREMFNSLLVYDDRSELSRIDLPVLLVWGDADPLVPRMMQDELMACLPQAELVVYAGVGHTPRWEQPERFANDVAAFVLEVAR